MKTGAQFRRRDTETHEQIICEALQQLNAEDWVLSKPRKSKVWAEEVHEEGEKARRSLRLVIVCVLGVKNKGEPCSHRAGMSLHDTRQGMRKTVTLLNAAQTHWRLHLGIRLQRCV